MKSIVIQSESDLYSALEEVLAASDSEEWSIEFSGWPRYEVTLRGESFDGGVPTRIMPALLDLQRRIDHEYARIKYGDESKRLSKDDRKSSEIIVRFEKGSTTFVADLWTILNNLAAQAFSRMNGTEIALTIFSLAAISGGVVAYKAYLRKLIDQRELDHRVDLSEQETRRLEIMSKVVNRSPVAQEQVDSFDESRRRLLGALHPDDKLVLGGEPVIDGEIAREAIRRPRRTPIDDRLDGQFLILTVDSGGVEGGFRLKVQRTGTAEELTVQVPEGTLSEEQVTILQSGEWGKRSLFMQMNIKRLDNRITEATLVKAGLQSSD